MTGKERIELALQLKQADCVATFEWFIDEKVGKAMTGSADPIEVVEALDVDGINIRADYTKEFSSEDTYVDEWGLTKRLTGDCVAAPLDSPIKNIARHKDYVFPDTTASHRFRSLEKALNRFGDRRAVILNLRDGFSDMRDLLGYEESLIQFMIEPELFCELLDRSVDYNLELARIAKERFGTNIVATTDDIANDSGLFFRPELYMERLGPAFRRVIQGYREMGYFVIKHCDGDVTDVIDFWIEAGIDCLDPIDPGAGMRLDDMRAKYGNSLCLKGNVDCKEVLCTGTAEEVAQEVKIAIQQAGKSAYICSSSNTIHQGVNPENYRVMLDAIRQYGRA
ncbi:MAG: uroporphyrinogen decarboxylase family protein [Planctomycetota bacterium]|jgi:uroporphyrinogen decarboxylase